MISKNISAFTETDYGDAYYPAYYSLNQKEDASIWLSVRSRGGDNVEEIQLTESNIKELAQDIEKFLESIL